MRPLSLFLAVFRPAILVLNGLGNDAVCLAGLEPGHAEGRLHSTYELKLLVAASKDGDLVQLAQQEVVERAFGMSDGILPMILGVVVQEGILGLVLWSGEAPDNATPAAVALISVYGMVLWTRWFGLLRPNCWAEGCREGLLYIGAAYLENFLRLTVELLASSIVSSSKSFGVLCRGNSEPVSRPQPSAAH